MHDDQVGPFARMVFDGVNITFQSNGKSYSGESLSTSWRGDDGSMEAEYAKLIVDTHGVYRKSLTKFAELAELIFFKIIVFSLCPLCPL